MPSSVKPSGCSRASTVLGCVPAATNTVCAGNQCSVPVPALLQPDAARRAVVVDVDADRRHALGEPDAFLQRLLDLLVVQRVRGAVDQAAAVGDGDAAPVAQHLGDARFAPGRPGLLAFLADRARVGQELLGDLALVVVPRVADRVLADLVRQRLVAVQELLDLHHVVGQRLGGGIDRGEAAADHHHRQAQLHVRDRVGLGRARELQRHQEIRCRAHAARQPVRDVQHGRAAGAHAERDVVEAHLPRVVGRQRAAEAHAAEHRELRCAAPPAGGSASGSSCPSAP